jgi:hypothetical protein
MALLKFSKLPKHRSYDYLPRYWDPKKEELAERFRLAEQRGQQGAAGLKARIAGGFRQGHFAVEKGYRTRQVRRSNLTLLGVLIALLYIFFKYFGLAHMLGMGH